MTSTSHGDNCCPATKIEKKLTAVTINMAGFSSPMQSLNGTRKKNVSPVCASHNGRGGASAAVGPTRKMLAIANLADEGRDRDVALAPLWPLSDTLVPKPHARRLTLPGGCGFSPLTANERMGGVEDWLSFPSKQQTCRPCVPRAKYRQLDKYPNAVLGRKCDNITDDGSLR